MSKCEGEAARQDVSQVTLSVASDVCELIFLLFFCFVFFLACYTMTCHIWECFEKKGREGPRSPGTGNVQGKSEKLARASLVSAFNVSHDGSVGLRGAHRLYTCARKGNRYKLFSCMQTRPHRGRALTDPPVSIQSRCGSICCLLFNCITAETQHRPLILRPFSGKFHSRG